jgi:hypothetical protein
MEQPQSDLRPQARTAGLLTESVGAEAVVYDTESAVAHRLRPVAAAVFARCDGTNTVAEISALVSSELAETVGVDDVEDALAQLREHNLLMTPAPEQTDDGVSRRLMLRRTAAVGGAAMAAPLIASIVAPTPAFATNTCKAIGNTLVPCNSSTDCGCPPNTPIGQSCTPSTPGTCGCYAYGSGPDGGFTKCGKPPSGYAGWCAYHPPASLNQSCSPCCASGTNGAPPCVGYPTCS